MNSKQQPKQSKSKLEALKERAQQAEIGGGAERVEKQHAAGKMTARERVDFLLTKTRSRSLTSWSCIARATLVSTSNSIPVTA